MHGCVLKARLTGCVWGEICLCPPDRDLEKDPDPWWLKRPLPEGEGTFSSSLLGLCASGFGAGGRRGSGRVAHVPDEVLSFASRENK